MKKLLFTFVFLIILKTYCLEIICPHGCGGPSDPNIHNVGTLLIQNLEQMKLVKPTIYVLGDSDDESKKYSGFFSESNSWSAVGWSIWWQAEYCSFASYDLDIDDYDSDEDENYEQYFDEHYEVEREFYFSRRKSLNSKSVDEVFTSNLKNYLETKALLQLISYDIYFLHDNTQICNNRCQLFENLKSEIHSIYLETIKNCIQTHNWTGSIYVRGLLNFENGLFTDAFDDVSEYLNIISDENCTLPSETYLQKGIIESEINLYNDAILSLSKAIELDPKNNDAYFERAIAYFETGKFELALNDYLLKGKEAVSTLPPDGMIDIEFGIGMLAGAANGIAVSSTELLPTIYSSIGGVGNLIWATIQHPIDTPKQLILSTIEFCDYLRSCELTEIVEILAPEMYEAIANWDALGSKRRGELIGYTLGKYGTDVLLPIAVMKGAKYVKAYLDIKRADKFSTLETLSKSKESKEALIQASAKWQGQRKSWFANVQIEVDKQSKHIRSAHNFDPTKSEWTHPHPDIKLKALAGKGQKVRGEVGQPGYRERVDCGEIIGFYVNEQTKERSPTSMAIIHYSKNGAHIVPSSPKK